MIKRFYSAEQYAVDICHTMWQKWTTKKLHNKMRRESLVYTHPKAFVFQEISDNFNMNAFKTHFTCSAAIPIACKSSMMIVKDMEHVSYLLNPGFIRSLPLNSGFTRSVYQSQSVCSLLSMSLNIGHSWGEVCT